MQKKDKIKSLALLIFMAGVVAYLITNNFANRTVYAFSSGPPAGYTGAPGEFTCKECHVPDSGAGTGHISIDAPQTYVPGQTYQITVTHVNSDPTRLRWGFELTAIDDSFSKAGELQNTTSFTRIRDNQGPGNNRQYIEHNSSGTFINQQGGASWTFNWTAPPTNVGPVTFYVAGNQANNDGNTSGDLIYFTFAQAQAGGSNSIQLNSATYTVGEASGNIAVNVTRTGDTSGTGSVDYATSDTAGLTACNQANTGIASSRCDYANTVGTLRFAAGETAKTIFIPIVNDSYSEGAEKFTVSLSNPTGATLGSVSSATITITDNDATTGGNPIVDPAFFVRQQYIDFLGREPDPAGLAGWLNVLNNCGTTVAQPCDRIEVSAGFFRSPEFQDRGYFIYKFYSAGLGRTPHYSEFVPDLAKVSGFLSDAQLEANKVAFINEFMARSEYISRYGSLTDNAAYVNALLQTAGLPNHPLKQPWIDVLNNGTATRAQVLRAFTESVEAYNKFYNEAFVVMQYFGYLRRDPDILYLQWIQTMSSNGGDYRAMINGFMNSSEYFLRFGP